MDKSVGDSPQGRVVLNPGQPGQTGSASQVQGAPQPPGLREPDRRSNSSALQVLTPVPAVKSNRLRADGWLVTEPVLAVEDQDFTQLALPAEVWHLILTQLSDSDQVRAMRSCRGLYHWGRKLVQTRLHPESALGQQQRADCVRELRTIAVNFLRAKSKEAKREAKSGVKSDGCSTAQLATLFQTKLAGLAGSRRCLEVDVLAHLEIPLLDALLTGARWQSVQLNFDYSAYAALFKVRLPEITVVRRLEERLAARQRKAAIDLVVTSPTPENWSGALPSNTALLLTGLQLNEAQFGDLDALPGFRFFLESDNVLERLSFHGCDGNPDAMLAWLEKGSYALTHLALTNAPGDAKLLLEVLASKKALTSLAFDGLGFRPAQLTLAELLQAAPGLEKLDFGCLEFEIGAMPGSFKALQKSSLREIEFDSCHLGIASDQAGQNCHAEIRDTHKEFLDGVRAAPKLQVLTVSQQMPPNTILAHSQALMLYAFALNPQARLLCSKSRSQPWLRLLEHFLKDANATRQEQGWPPVALRIKTDHGMEEFDFIGDIHS
jgi:hypothetical protein